MIKTLSFALFGAATAAADLAPSGKKVCGRDNGFHWNMLKWQLNAFFTKQRNDWYAEGSLAQKIFFR